MVKSMQICKISLSINIHVSIQVRFLSSIGCLSFFTYFFYYFYHSNLSAFILHVNHNNSTILNEFARDKNLKHLIKSFFICLQNQLIINIHVSIQVRFLSRIEFFLVLKLGFLGIINFWVGFESRSSGSGRIRF